LRWNCFQVDRVPVSAATRQQNSKESLTAADHDEIRSTSNPTVRRLVRLRDNRFRRRSRRVIVDGWRECRRAIEAGLDLCGVYCAESPGEFHELVRKAGEVGKLQRVTPEILEKIGYGQSARGVVAEFHQPDRTLQSLTLPEQPFILVLDRIEKPGNVGAVFRCADAAGVDAVVLTDGGDLFNPNAIRSSLGTVFRVPAAVATAAETQAFLAQRDIRVLAARVESSNPLWASDLSGSLAVVLGNEAEGLADRWQALGSTPIQGIQIPMAGVVDSLNISVSAAVIAYEVLRVRSRSDC
tara:strand:- start:215168 stop:216058 length:891 start_codon:yes stop_codon:yes gene_type:complete